MLDLLVRDGMIIDGTGNPGFYGAVGVEEERVQILRGDLAGIEAARVIDARGTSSALASSTCTRIQVSSCWQNRTMNPRCGRE